MITAISLLDLVARLNLAEIKGVIVFFRIDLIILAGQTGRVDRVLVYDAALKVNPGNLDYR